MALISPYMYCFFFSSFLPYFPVLIFLSSMHFLMHCFVVFSSALFFLDPSFSFCSSVVSSMFKIVYFSPVYLVIHVLMKSVFNHV